MQQQQLDSAVLRARKSATHLMRNLLATFFTPEILAESSALGTGAHKGLLDRNILNACIRKLIL